MPQQHELPLEKLEELQSFEDDSNETPPSDIISYNELRSCADLFRMHKQGVLDIKPEFQRDVVWQDAAQTRFIDSLIKQLPIPSMCFSLDYKSKKWLVIDGLQRISAIIRFLEGKDWVLSSLSDIIPEIAGKSVADIKEGTDAGKGYYSLVENLTIPVTVLRCDYSKKSHMEYLFTIFHRLNSGGMKLNNQEIRNCIYSGSFNNLLKHLDEYPPWRKLNKMKPKEKYRLSKQELILRFFAFSDEYLRYHGSLVRFLNSYMQENRMIDSDVINSKQEYFTRTVDCINQKIFDNRAPVDKLSLVTLEALLVGVGKNIDYLETQPPAVLKRRYRKLIEDEAFSEIFLREGLSHRGKVIDRLGSAIGIFSEDSE